MPIKVKNINNAPWGLMFTNKLTKLKAMKRKATKKISRENNLTDLKA